MLLLLAKNLSGYYMRIFLSILFFIICQFSAHADDYPTSLGGDELSYGVCSDIDDPFEKLNRRIFMFNSVLDHFLLRPVARGYNNMFSENTRARVGNFLENTQVPLTIVNNTLQLEGHKALLSFWQFMINSTLGVGGIEDVAKKRELHVEPQTLGSTLASYGVGPGPYIILPFFPGSSFRDVLDTPIANSAMNPLVYQYSTGLKRVITGTRLAHDRGEILPMTDHIAKTSPDPYVTIRSYHFQHRESKVHYPKHYRCRHE
jgi:phospholipid-binding lipoprotein MlaA